MLSLAFHPCSIPLLWPPCTSLYLQPCKVSKHHSGKRVVSDGGTVSFGVASIILIVGGIDVSGSSGSPMTPGKSLTPGGSMMLGSSLTPGVGLEGGLVWGLALAMVRPRIFTPVFAASTSPGAWDGGWGLAVQVITVPSTEPVANLGCDELWGSAVQMITVPSTEPVANLGCDELWSHATPVNAARPLVRRAYCMT